MEDAFRVRVDKAFGSLASSSPSSSSLRSLWSLSDEEVERKEWNRGTDSLDREETPCFSSFDGFFRKDRKASKKESRNIRKEFDEDLEDIDDDDEDEQQGRDSSGQSADRDGHDQEEWEIRSSIGLDCTLDNEEEEDEYDKVAVGNENTGDRLYMRDITDHGDYLNFNNVFPISFEEATRDPRANHLAAIIRLKEDEAEAVKSDSSQVSDKTVPAALDPQVSEGVGNLKSILKRKENQTDSKSRKRVRFDPKCENNHESDIEEPQELLSIMHSMGTPTVAEDGGSLPQGSHGIPDYLLNPSRYTCYSFDSSSGVDEESNQQAYMDLLSIMKKPSSVDTELDGTCTDASKSIVFTPKKKASDASTASRIELEQTLKNRSEEYVRKAGLPLCIPVGEDQEGEACAMDEDELGTATTDKSSGTRKLARQYRLKVQLDDSDA
ncbi:uncharacterized protein LOC122672907 [Telopea speciosissima]|uniref:uncharacterized protein LOC122672907 n=1 Tax=Telopea speciosissima TaxID=54955 RepID=UPI001CC421F5|nr:uncharacterized protein LOC122672907 [Telopea speciosissima]